MDTRDSSVSVGDTILLTYQGQDLAVFTVESKWAPNKPKEAKHCYGTTSIEHPAVSMITTERGKFYLGAQLPPLPKPCFGFMHSAVGIAFQCGFDRAHGFTHCGIACSEVRCVHCWNAACSCACI